jgi:hypothetical protein
LWPGCNGTGEAAEKFYICKETIKGNNLKDKHAFTQSKVCEAILKEEVHVISVTTPLPCAEIGCTGTKQPTQYSVHNCQVSVLLKFTVDSTNAMSIESLRGKFDCWCLVRAPTYISSFDTQ